MNWRKAIVVAAVVWLVAAAPIAPAKADSESEIKALQDAFVASVKAKDLDGIMKYYVPDETLFVFDVVPPRQFVGATAYRKDWEEFITAIDGPVTFEMSDLAVTADANLAYAHSIQHVTAKIKNGGDVDFTLRITDVFRKKDGKWAVIHEHASVPVDVSTGTADLNSKP